MAAYAATVTSPLRRASKVSGPGGGPGNAVWMFGDINITNYNSTLVEITDITKHFQGTLIVLAASAEGAYSPVWIPASNSFKLYDIGDAGETSDDTDAGLFHWVAMGLLGI